MFESENITFFTVDEDIWTLLTFDTQEEHTCKSKRAINRKKHIGCYSETPLFPAREYGISEVIRGKNKCRGK
jgi:hypothetical protein